MGGGSFGVLLEAGTNYQAGGSEGNKKISHFKGKYKGKLCHSLEIDLNHPFLDELKISFDKHIVGQQKAKDYLIEAVLDSVLRVGDIKGPLGVFFFHGPTGVGKTEIVKALAETMFGDSNGFIKISCENLQQSHNGSTLFGAPPGYIGFDKTPRLTNKNVMLAYDVAKQTKKLNKILNGLPWFNILLFDEIEKAHPDIIQQFLSLIDEGRVITSNGEIVNFENSIIIFTSNIGQRELSDLKKKNTIGFASSGKADEIDLSKQFDKSLKEKLSPEFIGRIHNFVEFNELTISDCKDIIDINVNNFNQYLLKYFTESHIQIELSPDVYKYIEKKGYSREKGARELVRTFNTLIRRFISRVLHSNDFKKYYDYEGEVLLGVDIDEKEKLVFDIVLDGKSDIENKVELLESKEETKQNLSLEKLNKIYEFMSVYVELTYINLDGDIDMKDELKIYADKLKEFGLSQIDISSLKNRAYLEGLRDLVFISDFEGIRNGDDTIKDLFYPYETRTIVKIVERKLASIYGKKGNIIKRRFITEGTKSIVEIITKLLRVEELSGSQINQLLFYVRKVLVEKYGLQNDY